MSPNPSFAQAKQQLEAALAALDAPREASRNTALVLRDVPLDRPPPAAPAHELAPTARSPVRFASLHPVTAVEARARALTARLTHTARELTITAFIGVQRATSRADGPRRRPQPPTVIVQAAVPAEDSLVERGQAATKGLLDAAVSQTIDYLVQNPLVQRALIEDVVRSPVMDTVIVELARRAGTQQALAELVRSPALDDALRQAARSPALHEGIQQLADAPATEQAIDKLAHSPALAELVQTQSTSFAGGIIEELRQHSVSADNASERVVRRTLGRSPRALLPESATTLARDAGAGSRLVAIVIDLLVVGLILTVGRVSFDFLYQTSGLPQLIGLLAPGAVQAWSEIILTLGLPVRIFTTLLIGFVYFTVFYWFGGVTIGKHVLGLRVVTADGRALNLRRAALRTLSYPLSALPLYLGFLAVLVDNRRRGWHDRLSRTRVMYTWDARPDERFLREV
ncbi:MAG: RDD family protein [Roseiflexaceae bacterium]|nr:RDD family protein [Roseiflexaceae bacterium]